MYITSDDTQNYPFFRLKLVAAVKNRFLAKKMNTLEIRPDIIYLWLVVETFEHPI